MKEFKYLFILLISSSSLILEKNEKKMYQNISILNAGTWTLLCTQQENQHLLEQ